MTGTSTPSSASVTCATSIQQTQTPPTPGTDASTREDMRSKSESTPAPGYSSPRSIVRVLCGHMRCQLDVNNMCANFASDEVMPDYAGSTHCRDKPPPPLAPKPPVEITGDVTRLEDANEPLKLVSCDKSRSHASIDQAGSVGVGGRGGYEYVVPVENATMNVADDGNVVGHGGDMDCDEDFGSGGSTGLLGRTKSR